MDLRLVHTGQHYDPEMSAIFFKELRIPKPALNLEAGSGSHATQTARIMQRLEEDLVEHRPDLTLVPGDTNTTLGGALAAAKLGIPVGHVEAGLRSGDLTMPEEINRKLTDHCSTMLFSPTTTASSNLRREGLTRGVWLTGDTMVDALRTTTPFVERREKAILDEFDADDAGYVLVTLHRPSNVDDLSRLRQIYRTLSKLADGLPVIFPVHPRTKFRLVKVGALRKRKHPALRLVNSQGYVKSLALLKNSCCLLTDSGGMQKEAFLYRVPCITLRPNTEWPETLQAGANRLVTNLEKIPQIVSTVAVDNALKRRIRRLRNPFGDGRAASRIVRTIEKELGQKRTA